MHANETQIARHKTAIRRPSYSLPIKCLLRDGLVHAETTVFDYGCGHGQDIEVLRGSGIPCDGWDPAFRADGEKKPADVVNIGYVSFAFGASRAIGTTSDVGSGSPVRR